MALTLPRAPNCTIRRAVPGLPQAASTRHALLPRQHCSKTAWSLSQGDLISPAMLPRAPNCPSPASRMWTATGSILTTRHAVITRRRYCKTAWSLLQGDLTATELFLRARNWHMVIAKIYREGSKKRTYLQLKSIVPKRK